MYEQYFGLRARPFAMTPDPAFYFEGRGQRRAFAYVRYAALEGESFIVLTGDTGVGKTTLVHRLLKAVESQDIVAALLGGTQLDASQLFAAILAAFRASVAGDSLDELRAGLQAFLTTVTASGRRALIVVDEAQHLLPDAVQELMALAATQSGRGSPLQVLLVGQPELRAKLARAPADAIREPVFLFCDLGLLSPAETRLYIEHRLRHVQWTESPAFSSEAHERISEATDGVPRRINRLCDRLLTAAFQRQLDEVSADLVREIDDELRSEVGDAAASASEADEMSSPAQDASAQVSASTDDASLAPAPIHTRDPTAAIQSEEPASQETRGATESRPTLPRKARAAKPALVAAVALVFASFIFWWAYEHETFFRNQGPSSPGEAARTAAGKVTSQGEPSAATAQAPEITAPVAAASQESAPAPMTETRSGAPEATSARPGAAGSPERPADAVGPVDVSRDGSGPVNTELDSPRGSRVQAVAGAPRVRASRRSVVPASASDQPAPPEPRVRSLQPPPVPGPCNAAVAALGLCTP